MLPPYSNTNSDSAATSPVRSPQLTSSVAVTGDVDLEEDGIGRASIHAQAPRRRGRGPRRLQFEHQILRDRGRLRTGGGEPPLPWNQLAPDRRLGLRHRRLLNLASGQP